jgi:hypothetical protein
MTTLDTLACASFRLSARRARAALSEAALVAWSRTIELPEGPAAVMDCLRRMGCLVEWWPGAWAIRPVGGGLCQVGDIGLLEAHPEDLMIRVLAFRPRRLVLALAGARSLTVVDLVLRESASGCELGIRFERPAPGWAGADAWAARRLANFGARAAARLEWHLRERMRPRDAGDPPPPPGTTRR